MVKMAYACRAAAGLSGLCLLLALLLPGYLSAYSTPVWRVQAKFKTEEERERLAQQAALLDEPVFFSLYERTGTEPIAACLTPRHSLAHGVLSALSALFLVDKPVAAMEDRLPWPAETAAAAPPKTEAAPAQYCIDTAQTYPMQPPAIRFLSIGIAIGSFVFLCMLAVASGYLLRRARRTALAAPPAPHS